jgi:hypothetical protein
MMKAIVSLLLPGLVLLAGSSSQGQTWTQISTNASYDWDGIAVSADGMKLVATVGSAPGEGIYVSTNSGTSWSQTVSSNDWGSSASSADGTRLAVVNLDDSIYTSTNAGVTWNPANAPQNRWSPLASSADGSVLLAVGGLLGQFIISTNYGGTWFSPTNTGYGVAATCSADGSRMAVQMRGTGQQPIFIVSTNTGLTWQPAAALGSPNDDGVIGSPDGTRLFAWSSGFYMSTNWGVSWASTNQGVLGGLFACSADGSVLLAAATGFPNTFQIYSSTNYGATWVTNNVPEEKWTALACSADGNTLVAAAAAGGIWRLQTPLAPRLSLSSSNGELNFSWIVPSTNMVLEQSMDIVNWTTLTNCPSLDLTDLEEQLTLQPVGSGDFFRLVSQ